MRRSCSFHETARTVRSIRHMVTMKAFLAPAVWPLSPTLRPPAKCSRRFERAPTRRPRACTEAPNSESLLETMCNGTQPQQVLAIISLSDVPAEEAVSLLHDSGVLDSTNRQVRIAALATLGKLGVRQQADALIEVLLEDEDHSIRAAAANGLGSLLRPSNGSELDEITARAVEALIHAAKKDEHFIVRYAALVSVGNLEDPSAVSTLLPIAMNTASPPLEAAAAMTALGEVVDTQDVDIDLLQAVSARASDREEFVRAAVARTLGRWTGVGGARTSLQRMRDDEEKYGQSDLVRAILDDVFGMEE